MLVSVIEDALLWVGQGVTRTRGNCRDGRGGNFGCWFLTSRRYAWETLILTPLFLCCGLWLVKRWFRTRKGWYTVQCLPAVPHIFKTAHATLLSTVADVRSAAPPTWVKCAIAIHYALSWVYKLQRPLGWVFMFMPCLLLTFVMLLAAWAPSDVSRSFLDQSCAK